MHIIEAKEEALKCLNCNNPKCVEGCPINMDIPGFISYIKKDNLEEAYKIIRNKSYFGSICGRVCPHDKQCEGKCIKGIKGNPVKIGELEALVSDWGIEKSNGYIEKDINNAEVYSKKIAIIGGGAAGLTCAVELTKLGYDVTIFEKEDKLRGYINIWNT